MTDMISLAEHHTFHTCNEKGMGMEEWGRKDLGLISQRFEVHHSEYYAHIIMNQLTHQPNYLNELKLLFNRSLGDLFSK